MRILSLLFALLLFPVTPWAAQVTNLNVHQGNPGQSFITWSVPSPTTSGWVYRLYASGNPIVTPADLDGSTHVGSVNSTDSTWCDRWLSRGLGRIISHKIDSLGAPLDSSQALLVFAIDVASTRYYAVTAQSSGQPEDRTMTPGENSLTAPILEIPAPPRLVYQYTDTLPHPWGQRSVFTFWPSPIDTPDLLATSNKYGVSYGCGVRRGGTDPGYWHALMISFHTRGGNYIHNWGGTGIRGEWGLAVDDHTFSPEVNTWWFGHHEDYDTELGGSPPTSGNVIDYTLRRLDFTVRWALDNFPVDRSRIYAGGSSMGAIGAIFFSYWRPDLVAAAYANASRVNFSLDNDPNLYDTTPFQCSFNDGQGQRVSLDRMFGRASSNLLGPDGLPAYDWMNCERMAEWREASGIPHLATFSGRMDATIGWAEKPGFFAATRTRRLGGIHFWDKRTHVETSLNFGWGDAMLGELWRLYRFRNDRSYPALSDCSANQDPGDGTIATGDTLGQINAFVEWDSLHTDTQAEWRMQFRLRDLVSRWGPVPAPESLTVGVTPRRLQQFTVYPGATYWYEVSRSSDNAIVRSGSVVANPLGVITIPSVPVYKTAGSQLTIIPDLNSLGSPLSSGSRLWLAPVQSPVRDNLELAVLWPESGPADVRLFDLLGRQRQVLFDRTVEATQTRINVPVSNLPSGIYFLRARQHHLTASARFSIMR